MGAIFGNGRAILGLIPSGAEGTRTTLNLMRIAVHRGKINPLVRYLAIDQTRGLLQKDYPGEVERLFHYVRDQIRYTKDIRDVELIHDADQIIAAGAGDCDDKSILLASLLESIGHRTRFVAIGYKPGTYCHVFVETLIGRNWYALDPTEPQNAGWRPGIRSKAKPMIVHN